ncbi:MAG: hypothetical protein M1816_001493 [Peltula sp. TS41687]|nr:MAG: hypothetical protein M1816_001493 [Peltula sp. TS41687]
MPSPSTAQVIPPSTPFRLINIDLLDPESPSNFDLLTLLPPSSFSSSSTSSPPTLHSIQQTSTQTRQLLRGGDTLGALRCALENTPYGAAEQRVKDAHLATVLEVLQSIRQADMAGLLRGLLRQQQEEEEEDHHHHHHHHQAGRELADRLGKYLWVESQSLGRGLEDEGEGKRYKGMAMASSGNTTNHATTEGLQLQHGGSGAGRKVSSSASSVTPAYMTPQATGGFGHSSQRGGADGAAGGGGGSGAAMMSVLLSWHEKLVEIAGLGCIVRVMSDRRTV